MTKKVKCSGCGFHWDVPDDTNIKDRYGSKPYCFRCELAMYRASIREKELEEGRS